MYFLAHCWECFFPFYLAVRLVWPKIRIDFFLPFNWASEKIGPWLAVHYLFSLILGSSAMSAHSLRSNFVFPFTWASHLLAKLEVIILLPCPWAFHFKPATFTKSYGYALVLLLSWANLCSMGYKQIFFCKTLSWVHGLEAAMVAFSIHMLKTHGHCLVWKIMLWLPNNTLY